ncbi:hypothetical protein FPQ18DRAFT_385896 [Pyronema domesticum]|uniref:RRM domain-containing protein n=1 Tax=Pyronema omphalodes (strain CBS 100304) TaxID=1076935 RepID=U4L8A0_PYROM|nr:hypothetical protein FPQ18DRAFT_385896 [Pyronema domesticum]CCX13072.1 Similar to conserved hypothetical protein [Aspergillus clavatus NRRL 1]; acc. no. XP_001275262 [Pyronema omphalodes CBS 100304]
MHTPKKTSTDNEAINQRNSTPQSRGTFDPYKYGRPGATTTRVPPSPRSAVFPVSPYKAPEARPVPRGPITPERPTEQGARKPFVLGGADNHLVPNISPNVNTSGLQFAAWPQAEGRSRAPGQKRSVIISGLPPQATLADLSAICAGTGIVERFDIREHGKALVHFFDQETADKFLARTDNGTEYKKTVLFVDQSIMVDIIPGRIREAIEKGARRIVRIVGIEDAAQLKQVLKRLDPTTDLAWLKEKTEDQLMQQIAKFFGIFDVQLAGVRTNSKGYKEGRIIYGKTETAMKAFAALSKVAVLEECNITYGDDPCELPVTTA